jgi:hypothetical protein
MTLIAFPSVLPAPEVSSIGIEPGNNLVRTDFESGPARVRRTSRKPTSTYGVAWIVELEDLGVFEYWFENIALDGVLWFTTRLVNGADVQDCEARFIGKYSVSARSSKIFQISASLEVRNAPRISAVAYEVLTTIGNQQFQRGEAILDHVVNTELPSYL